MKAPSWLVPCAAVLAMGLVALSGCTRETSHAPPVTKVVVTNVSPPPVVTPAPQTNAPVTPPPEASAPTAKVAPQRIPLPPPVAEVVDLAQSQVGDAVLIEYVKKITSPFELNADQVIYLNDIGMSEQVLAALVQRSHELGAVAVAPSVPAVAEVPVASPPTQSPAVAETAPAPPPAPVPAPVAAPPAAPVYAEGTAAPPAPAVSAPVAAPAYAQPVTQSYFYSSLSPYGAWVEIPGYGWCWQPTVAVVDPYWRPYCHGGRWLYTDCGWYWQSTYSWGWAPFHYGTWYRSSACGWVWVPGYVWSPAWVTWRYTDAYCGWAPLPPGCGWGAGVGLTYYGSGVSVGFSFGLGWDCFSFVHYRHFCDPHPHHHCLPRHEATVVYHRSAVINDYHHGDHNTVVNRGIAPNRISAVTRSEIRKVPIRDVTNEPDAPRRADRLERDGRQLAVYRPQPTTAAPGQPAPASRHTQEVARPGTPERSAVSSGLVDVNSRAGTPLSGGRTRSESAPPTRTAAPASPAPSSPAVGSAPSRVTRSESSSAPRTVDATRSTAPASGSPTRSEVAPVRSTNPAVSRSPQTSGSSAPAAQGNSGTTRATQPGSPPAASTVTPSQPTRVERVPASRTSTSTTSVPTGVPRTSTPTTRSTPSVPSVSTSGQSGSRSATPVYAPTATPTPSTSRSSGESRASTRSESPRSESLRSEPRKLEPVAPSSVPAPKLSTGGRSVYDAGGGAVSVPGAARSPAASTPSGRSAPAPSPAYSAPSRQTPSAPSAPAYNAPTRSPGGAPSSSAPRSGGGTSGGGGRARSVQE